MSTFESPVTRSVIGESLSGRRNSLNFLRLVFALMVIVWHVSSDGGWGNRGVVYNGTALGTIGVYGFFAVSGFLIASSALRNRTGRYLWQRVLRIFPAFWVVLIVTAGFFGVIGWLTVKHPSCPFFACYFHAPDSPLGYVYRNSLLHVSQQSIAGTPRNVVLPYNWNGSLWTLYYEFGCYLVIAGLALVGLLRRRIWVLLFALATWLLVVYITLTPSVDRQFNPVHNWTELSFLKLVIIFLAGSVIYLYRDKIPDSGWLALLCTIGFVGGLYLPNGSHIPPFWFTPSQLLTPLIAYPVLWLGIHLPFQRIGAKNDYSYGVYLYGSPVTQLLAGWQLNLKLGYVGFLALVLVGTIPFAVFSWWFVEKPAIRLKRTDWRAVWQRLTGLVSVRSLADERRR